MYYMNAMIVNNNNTLSANEVEIVRLLVTELEANVKPTAKAEVIWHRNHKRNRPVYKTWAFVCGGAN